MTSKIIFLCIILLILIQLASADFSCFFGDFICKHITCRNCEIATCITGDCVCTICT
ncbi:uncharacterized protein CELE_C54F6.20 [Caenorhabditis elegans]|uniref:Uncharacterized protein n=1 Tax=Caenorhabditis elegans TaxID=6239 RepID=A0A2C9C3H6_CAEEL|nr:Uncharacterized protein CELE_C54F6.20 [Caenorhabditis elegans]SOF58828.1 Uncharacterized protein CELE_C54F6.20 [Caenorhabditis elegans]|eukprot:NP_504937.5 Uncharacterized protein CELE_C54F6.20 [Caenorhabditis elegans]